MTDIICPACMTWHPEPKCQHNAEAPCADCGGPVGYRWQVAKGVLFERVDLCWRCALAQGLVPGSVAA